MDTSKSNASPRGPESHSSRRRKDAIWDGYPEAASSETDETSRGPGVSPIAPNERTRPGAEASKSRLFKRHFIAVDLSTTSTNKFRKPVPDSVAQIVRDE